MNPSKRLIPVVDGEGQPKCSFDARSDKMKGKFRMTTCVDDNTLAVTTYDDVLCTEESEYPAAMPLIFRGECIPLKQYDRPMQRGGDDMKGRGGDDKGRGRRLLQKDDKMGGKDDKMGGKDDMKGDDMGDDDK